MALEQGQFRTPSKEAVDSIRKSVGSGVKRLQPYLRKVELRSKLRLRTRNQVIGGRFDPECHPR